MKVKCKACGDKIERDEAFKIIRERPSGNTNEYYCSEDEYDNIQREKDSKYKCYETVRNIINIKMINPTWIKNINTIREFYDYNVIEKCFKENEDQIKWSIYNKDFKSEHIKSKYILAIIANNIEDTYKKHKKELEEMNRLFNKVENNKINIDIINNEVTRVKKRNNNDISVFLD